MNRHLFNLILALVIGFTVPLIWDDFLSQKHLVQFAFNSVSNFVLFTVMDWFFTKSEP